MRDHDELTVRYNYDSFTPENYEPWMNFEKSPSVGQAAPDFPLWTLDGQKTRLSEIWSARLFTVVEFGSFT
jgi:hypothetical protein